MALVLILCFTIVIVMDHVLRGLIKILQHLVLVFIDAKFCFNNIFFKIVMVIVWNAQAYRQLALAVTQAAWFLTFTAAHVTHHVRQLLPIYILGSATFNVLLAQLPIQTKFASLLYQCQLGLKLWRH